MLADPLTLDSTFNGIDSASSTEFVCIERASDHSLYRKLAYQPGEDVDVFVGHQFGKRNRVTTRFTVSKLIDDPTVAGRATKVSNSYYLVADEHPYFPLPVSRGFLLNNLAIMLVGNDGANPYFLRVIAGET